MNKLTALILFCGGGLMTGPIARRFRVVAAIDRSPWACEAHLLNHPAVPVVQADLKGPAEAVLKSAKVERVDYLHASSPCHEFSGGRGRRVFGGNKRPLYLKFLEYLRILKPKTFTVENVCGLLEQNSRQWLREAERQARELGYQTAVWTIDPISFGTVMKGKRVYLVGRLGNAPLPLPPTPTHEDPVPLSAALTGLSEADALRDGCQPITEKRKKILSSIPQGGCLGGNKRRDRMDRTIDRLLTNPSIGHISRVHPIENRHYSVREYACIFGVPEYQFPFGCSLAMKYRLIAEGNPPQMHEAVLGRLFAAHVQMIGHDPVPPPLQELGNQKSLQSPPVSLSAKQPGCSARNEDDPAIKTERSSTQLRSPYSWFGGKSRVAELVWSRFGNVPNYVEPFFGGGSVLLSRSSEPRVEIVNDINAWLTNFWRAIQLAPEETARYADWPVSELDLHARGDAIFHRDGWYKARGHESVQAWKEWIRADPAHYDAQIAGWWVWGQSSCILGNWGQNENSSRRIVKRARPHLFRSEGIHSQRVTRAVPNLDKNLSGTQTRRAREMGLLCYFQQLKARMDRVRVCCGDWSRVVGPTATTKNGNTAVFLDPPYAVSNRYTVYGADDDRSVAHKVREWALAHGDDPRFRIALCGYEGEHSMPNSWECVKWKAHGGCGRKNGTNQNRHRERIWFSPHCLKPSTEAQTAA